MRSKQLLLTLFMQTCQFFCRRQALCSKNYSLDVRLGIWCRCCQLLCCRQTFCRDNYCVNRIIYHDSRCWSRITINQYCCEYSGNEQNADRQCGWERYMQFVAGFHFLLRTVVLCRCQHFRQVPAWTPPRCDEMQESGDKPGLRPPGMQANLLKVSWVFLRQG